MPPDERGRQHPDDVPELPFCVDCHEAIGAMQRSVPADGRDPCAGLSHVPCFVGRRGRPFSLAS